MGVSKSDQFKPKHNQLAVLTKALGHPARIAIMEFLLKKNSCICNDIVDELPLSQPTVSQHLKELKNAGLIRGTVTGKAICYCPNPDAIKKLQNYFSGIVTSIELKNNKFCK